MNSEQVLVGDVGGTNVRLALASRIKGKIELSDIEIFSDPNLPSFDEVVGRYIEQTQATISQALFALAGPIEADGSIKLTNRAWPKIIPENIASRFGLKSVRIVNDFAAMARGVPELPDSEFSDIIESNLVPEGPILVTGPGTGFGISTLLERTEGWEVLTGEGGHAAFAPRTQREFDIMSTITDTNGYVSNEMIVSGYWLNAVYKAICQLHGIAPEELSASDIIQKADQNDDICIEVLQFRARAVMGAIGDAALISGAKRGVVLTGGVAKRIIPWLRSTSAIARFHERGPMTPYLRHTPVKVLLNGEAPLIGAAALQFETDAAA
ncbi:glucokinase [Ponticaulis profundi]|uniref:ROK family protein n=1 Tax=Ponticaulis profundi TaxID=2665222 RepID=A0ABW1SEQ2_9PROT